MAAKPFRFVDLFCGGGGSITGAVNACQKADVLYEGRGFNHWDIAIQTIAANHPEIVPDLRHACTPIESVIPDEIFTDDPTRLDVLWASPSCTHHSVAAGGKPRSNQLRSQPEHLLPYLRLTKCQRMIVENVPELLSWGPLLDSDTTIKGKKYLAGQPDPRRKGAFFDLWIKEIKASGYRVDWQILNSADYGAATSRERLIIQAARKSAGGKIIWPEPTHQQEPGLFSEQYKPWRTAAEIIDWSLSGESIFDRRRPLCQNTLRRIEAGIVRYWGEWAQPFLMAIRGETGKTFAVDLTKPLPPLTASRDLKPIWLDLAHTKTSGVSGTIDTPLNTICCSRGTHALIIPFLTRYNGGENRNHGVDAPMPVIDCSNRYGIIQPLFIPQQSAGTAKPVTNAMPTIATAGAIGLVTPFLLKYYGNEEGATTIGKPLDTITTKDRFGLVQGRLLTMPDGQQFTLDITHRMLTAKELAAATSFPDDYVFCGGDAAAKKQIGNAVPPVLAEALYRAILAA